MLGRELLRVRTFFLSRRLIGGFSRSAVCALETHLRFESWSAPPEHGAEVLQHRWQVAPRRSYGHTRQASELPAAATRYHLP